MDTRPPASVPVNGETAAGASDLRLQRHSDDLAHQDGRREPRESDRRRALHEIADPADEAPPEVPAGAETLVDWNAAPGESGETVPETPPDDESTITADQADLGRNDAENELRSAAAAPSGRTGRTTRP